MKEIQGKIKFVAIEYQNQNKTTKDGFDYDAIEKRLLELKFDNIGCYWTSKITEEQAAEFVRMMTFESDIIGGDQDCYENYLEDDCWCDTAKESLISLLKANDCETKEMVKSGMYYHAHIFDEVGCTTQTDVTLRWDTNKKSIENKNVCFAKPIDEYPDDLLLIKLQ